MSTARFHFSRTLRIGTVGLPARSPLAQGIGLFIAFVFLVLLLPLLLIGAIVAVVAVGVLAGKRWLAAARRPNGALDGRRNVRVRLPESEQ